MSTDRNHYQSLYTAEYFSGRRSFFYKLTGGYRDLAAVFDGYAANLRRYVSGGRLLDVGCAYGFLLKRFEDDFETFGFDISEHAIEQAHRVAPRSDLRVHSVLERFPYDDASFDAVTLTDVLEHVPHTDRILAEVARVCKSGAVVYVATPNRNLARRIVYGLADRMEHHINLLSFKELRGLLDQAGFESLEAYTSVNALLSHRCRPLLGLEQTHIVRWR